VGLKSIASLEWDICGNCRNDDDDDDDDEDDDDDDDRPRNSQTLCVRVRI